MAYKSASNNFAFNTWHDNFIVKLLFSIKWQLKLTKLTTKIMLINKLQPILKPECILNTPSWKPWIDNLIAIFTNAIKTNPVKNPVENLMQQNN